MNPRFIFGGSAALALLAALAALGIAAHSAHAGLIAIDASPNTDTNLVGEDHTVTALVTEGGPAQDWEVDFTILSGPNQGDSTTDVTDSNGEASFTYTGDGGTGTDQIQVCITQFVGPTGISAAGELPCETVEKTWVEPTPTPTPEPTATPTASATPTATPDEAAPAAELPETGSQPPSGAGLPWLGVAMLALGGATLLAGGWAFSRRSG